MTYNMGNLLLPTSQVSQLSSPIPIRCRGSQHAELTLRSGKSVTCLHWITIILFERHANYVKDWNLCHPCQHVTMSPCHHTTYAQPCHYAAHAITPPMRNHVTMPSHHLCATMSLCRPCHHTTYAQPCHYAAHAITSPMRNHVTMPSHHLCATMSLCRPCHPITLFNSIYHFTHLLIHSVWLQVWSDRKWIRYGCVSLLYILCVLWVLFYTLRFFVPYIVFIFVGQ